MFVRSCFSIFSQPSCVCEMSGLKYEGFGRERRLAFTMVHMLTWAWVRCRQEWNFFCEMSNYMDGVCLLGTCNLMHELPNDCGTKPFGTLLEYSKFPLQPGELNARLFRSILTARCLLIL